MAILKPEASDVRFSPTPSSDIQQKCPDRENQRRSYQHFPPEPHYQHDNYNHNQQRLNQIQDKPVVGLIITFSGYNVTSSMPALGIKRLYLGQFSSTRSPVFTTSFIGSDDIPIPMAGLPSTRIKVEGGLRYPFLYGQNRPTAPTARWQ